jgi:hypothetical protein
MNDTIMTLHPQGTMGVNIQRDKYDQISEAIINLLAQREMSFTDLMQGVEQKLSPDFDGSIPWYVTTVRLDLEARNTIERIPRTNPELLRLNRT